jgi:hypothetical protein
MAIHNTNYYSDCPHDSGNAGSLPKHNPNYFQITQPVSSNVTPPHQNRHIIYYLHLRKLCKQFVDIFFLGGGCIILQCMLEDFLNTFATYCPEDKNNVRLTSYLY